MTDAFINGEYEGKSERFENVDPMTSMVVSQVVRNDKNDVDRAVQAAKAAMRGPWGKTSANDRADLLDKVADEIIRRKDEFLKAEIADTGKPISFAGVVDIPRGAANFRIFAQMLRADASECFETPTADGKGALNYVLKKPLGVVGVICPWNLPFLLMTWKVAPAMAAGNAVVVKPSEETPQSAALLGEVMNSVGVPKGAYNVVHGFGPGEAGEAIVTHPDIRAITFTGESRTGAAIQKAASPWVKPLSFELGGKNPSIVFADADFEAAIAGTMRSVFSTTGQVCLCSERVYVERPIFDRFVSTLAERTATLVSGNPFDEKTNFGPLISAGHRDKVASYFEIAKQEKGEIVKGACLRQMPAPYEKGFFVEPTIVTGLSDDARFCREEVFGPVCHIAPFDDEDEVIARANDTDYGLCGAVWTQNLRRAHYVASELEVGIAWVNTWYLRDLRTPFGGSKMSGVGREGGRYSFEFYTELKNICIKL